MYKDKIWFKILLGTLLLAIIGPLSINMQGFVPVTLQSVGIILVPIIFGWRAGVVSIVFYLLLGAFGVPIFADFKSGWQVFAGPTAGFLFGFIPTGFFAGWYAERVKVQYGRFFFLFVAAHFILLFFGLVGLLLSGLSFAELWKTILFLVPGIMIKSFLGAFVILAIKMKKT